MFDKKYKQIIKILVNKVDALENELNSSFYRTAKNEYMQKQRQYFEMAKSILRISHITSEISVYPIFKVKYTAQSDNATVTILNYENNKVLSVYLHCDEFGDVEISNIDYQKQLIDLLNILGVSPIQAGNKSTDNQGDA